jgi:hypothetical protein
LISFSPVALKARVCRSSSSTETSDALIKASVWLSSGDESIIDSSSPHATSPVERSNAAEIAARRANELVIEAAAERLSEVDGCWADLVSKFKMFMSKSP